MVHKNVFEDAIRVEDVVATVDRVISVVDGRRAHAFNIIHSIIYY